jgi:uncharacterized membrane protein YvbJ
MTDEVDDYGYFIDIELLDIDIEYKKIKKSISNTLTMTQNNKKHDDIVITEKSISKNYIIIANICFFCIFIVVYIYVSPPFK